MNRVTARSRSGKIGAVHGPATIGESCVDRYLPPIGRDTPGGNALNVAAGLAAAGLPTAHVGAVGDDAEGRFVLAQAAGRGIDAAHLAVVPGGRTGLTTITVTPEGDRVFASEELGVSASFRPSDEAVAFLTTRSWVHATGPADIADALRAVAAAGVPISYDVYHPPRTERLHELAPLLAVAFLSAPDGDAADAAELARDAVARGARAAVVGRGKDGQSDARRRPDPRAARGPRVRRGHARRRRRHDRGGGRGAAGRRGAGGRLERGALAAAAACERLGAWEPA